jgi:predicted glycoside hydrolase/deacetylase ChbG (UPF0249 family)
MSAAQPMPCLVVSADDYGNFRGVSAGIIEAATRGIVTATAVFATGERFDDEVPALRDCVLLDAGVHLNLTDGRPLTPDMRARVQRWGGRFPGKFAMGRAVATGVVPLREIEIEWQAQIERCLDAGLKIQFLNSHEHIHMLPALFALTLALAEDYGIAHVRLTGAHPSRSRGGAAWLRSGILAALATFARLRAKRPVARFLGLEESGRLSLADLDSLTARLEPGTVYELMCHPGRLDPADAPDPRLLGYHDWDGELATLTDPRARALLDERGIRLVGYRDLQFAGNRLAPRASERGVMV